MPRIADSDGYKMPAIIDVPAMLPQIAKVFARWGFLVGYNDFEFV